MYRQVQTKVSQCLAQRAQVFPTVGCSFRVSEALQWCKVLQCAGNIRGDTDT